MTRNNKNIKVNYNLKTVNPVLARQWHPTKNIDLKPKDVTPGSNKKVWWRCNKGHEWETRVYMRNRGSGCPYCSGKAAHKGNSLQTLKPNLAREWHPTKNKKLTPKDVTVFSHKKVWWRCNKGHEWQAVVSSRSKNSGCPYCGGRLSRRDSCLKTVRPNLAKEWHSEKNDNLTPIDVTPYSTQKVWWICDKGHEWQTAIYNRSKGTGCPYCKGKAVCEDNCLKTINPTLAREWHPTLNSSLTPNDVTPGSNKKVWWICNKNHEWLAVINNRNNGRGCPYCRSFRKTQKTMRITNIPSSIYAGLDQRGGKRQSDYRGRRRRICPQIRTRVT